MRSEIIVLVVGEFVCVDLDAMALCLLLQFVSQVWAWADVLVFFRSLDENL